jgi:hypothetical protein
MGNLGSFAPSVFSDAVKGDGSFGVHIDLPPNQSARREFGTFPGFTPTGLRNVKSSVRMLDSEREQNGFKSRFDRWSMRNNSAVASGK